jgi:hypothetical protein
LEIAREQQRSIRDHYSEEILRDIDAALAFVREMRELHAWDALSDDALLDFENSQPKEGAA